VASYDQQSLTTIRECMMDTRRRTIVAQRAVALAQLDRFSLGAGYERIRFDVGPGGTQ
jgi:hypothetical protein